MPITPFAVYPATGNAWQKFLQESIVTADAVATYTVAELADVPRWIRLGFVSNETGGFTLAFRDASDVWRRVQDRAICS